MITRETPLDAVIRDSKAPLVSWSEKYATGVKLIDSQHLELVNLTNSLYEACLTGDDEVDTVFKDALSRMVEYVRFHFSAELELLAKINYPAYPEHKKLHDELVHNILEAAKEYDEGKRLVPNHFVRTLKDWVFGHIAIYDKEYAAYVADQKSKGLLTDQMLEG